MADETTEDTTATTPLMSQILEQLNNSGQAEWDPQLTAVIRWEGCGLYGALTEPFQRSLSARIADLFHPHGLTTYLTSKEYRRIAKEENYEIWEIPYHAGGFDLVTVPTNTDSTGFDLAWEDALAKIATAEGWYVRMSTRVMIPETLQDAVKPQPKPQAQA